MKKTLVALAIASVSASAFAVELSSQNSMPAFEFNPMHKDQFSVSGSWGVGGYYDTRTEEAYDDWATGLTVAVNYKNNRLLGYLETDLEYNWATDEDVVGWDNDFVTDVDKAWLGYETDFGVLSFGWENDTALDKVDGAGDFTYEFGASAGDASDAFVVTKFQGSTGGIAYGISHFSTSDNKHEADKGYNGYLGLEQETVNVYVGYEDRLDADYTVISASGNATFGALKIGANFWIDSDDSANTDKEETGYYVTSAYSVSDAFTLAAGYAWETIEEDNESDKDASYFNVAAMYDYSDRISMGIDIKRELDVEDLGLDEETFVFAAAFYSF